MKSPVDDHFVPGGEGFTTKLTTVWPRVCVDALVFSQQISSLKVLWTKCTLKGSLMRVNTSDMEQQFTLPRVT